MRVDIEDSGIDVYFRYDPSLVAKIKNVPGHAWDPNAKCWHVPLIHAKELAREFSGLLSPQDFERLEHANDFTIYPPPPTLRDSMRDKIMPFQWQGYNFLLSKRKAFLLFDTGLGKSVTALLASEELFYLGKINQTIIFAPLPLLEQWKGEIIKFIDIDERDIIVVIGDSETRQDIYERVRRHDAKYIIMNYEKSRLEDFDLGNDAKRLIILDEVTRLKNFKSKTFRIFKNLNANYKFLLSGRVLENSPSEIYTLNTLLDNQIFGSFYEFKSKYAITQYNPIIKREVIVDWHNLDMLWKVFSNVAISYKVNDVLTQLPPIVRETYNVYPSEIERKVYKIIFDEIENLIKSPNINSEVRDSIFSLIVLEKEYCDSPRLIETSESKFGEYLRSMYNFDQDGTKLGELINVLDLARPGQIIIFTQYERMAKLIKRKLDTETSFTSEIFASDAPESVVSDFQANRFKILISTDKGAYGLNLGNASTIINYDLPWNPAILEQRIGRVKGFRQLNNILVINMLIPLQEMLEARVRDVLMRKQNYYSEVFG
ncbi:MAG: DEAD/DEAH box helicase [Candidatus Micrarchaeaceae archaeon]